MTRLAMVLPLVPAPATRAGRFAVLALEGGLVCTLGDQLHVRFGVITYPHPVLFGQAWWTPGLFVGAVAAMIASYPAVFRALRSAFGWSFARAAAPPAVARRATGEFFLAYALTAVAASHPSIVLAVLTAGFGLRLVVDWRTADDPGRRAIVLALPFVAGAAIVGPLAEITLIALGQFHYVHPHFFGIAMWLPVLYMWAAWAGRAMVHAWLQRD